MMRAQGKEATSNRRPREWTRIVEFCRTRRDRKAWRSPPPLVHKLGRTGGRIRERTLGPPFMAQTS